MVKIQHFYILKSKSKEIRKNNLRKIQNVHSVLNPPVGVRGTVVLKGFFFYFNMILCCIGCSIYPFSTFKAVLWLQDKLSSRHIGAFIVVLYTFQVLWSPICCNEKYVSNVLRMLCFLNKIITNIHSFNLHLLLENKNQVN